MAAGRKRLSRFTERQKHFENPRAVYYRVSLSARNVAPDTRATEAENKTSQQIENQENDLSRLAFQDFTAASLRCFLASVVFKKIKSS